MSGANPAGATGFAIDGGGAGAVVVAGCGALEVELHAPATIATPSTTPSEIVFVVTVRTYFTSTGTR